MSHLRFEVGPQDGPLLCDVLALMGDGARHAAVEGRAFLNGRRANANEPVKQGDTVMVWAARDHEAEEQVMVLAQWDEIVAVDKPASLPTTPDRRGTRSVVTELSALLGLRSVPHAASRLDVGVSGVVLCATGAGGNQKLVALREAGRIVRVYVGIVQGRVAQAGEWNAPVGMMRSDRGRAVPTAGGVDAKPATTRFWPIGHADGRHAATLLRLELVTGRMHQIRAHAAHAGVPLFGDKLRGGLRNVTSASGRVISIDRIALHALCITLVDEPGHCAVAQVPNDLRALWQNLDGNDGVWDEVMTARGLDKSRPHKI